MQHQGFQGSPGLRDGFRSHKDPLITVVDRNDGLKTQFQLLDEIAKDNMKLVELVNKLIVS